MQDFKFNAPISLNFYRKERKKLIIQIDEIDEDDLWFMTQHVELTPIKQLIIDQITIKCKKYQIQSIDTTYQIKTNYYSITNQQSISNPQINHVQTKLCKNDGKNVTSKPKNQKIKRSQLSEKYSVFQKCSSKNNAFDKKNIKKPIKNFLKKPKIQKKMYRSQSLPHLHEKSKIRMPCPYPLRIQRNWQSKSHKTWYSLNDKQIKKAMQSMKKMNQNRRKSSNKKKSLRFKF